MSHRSEVRKAELAVLEAARSVLAHWSLTPLAMPFWMNRVAEAVAELDKLDLVDPGAARHTRGAPLTSQMAARWMQGEQAKSLAGQIVRLIYDSFFITGRTVPELIENLNRQHQSVSARVNELRDLGWLVDSGRTRIGPSGAEATVWVLSVIAGAYLQDADNG